MDEIGVWMNRVGDYLKGHWQEHLVPAVAILGVTLVGIPILIGALLVNFAIWGLLGGAVRESGTDVDVVAAVGMAVGTVVIALLFGAAVSPLTTSYQRATLRSLRGTPIVPGDLLWGYRHFGSVIGMNLLAALASFAGTLLCVLPGLLVSWLLGYRAFALADREAGATDALGESWRLTTRHWLPVIVWEIIALFAVIMLAFVPLVGGLLSMPVYAAMRAVAYDSVRAAEAAAI
jgi:hypothetical protein